MASVGILLSDRVYGLNSEQAQFLGGQLQRRLTVPPAVADLADQLWEQSMRNPNAGEVSQDIVLTKEQTEGLLDTMSAVRPEGDTAAWDELVAGLRRGLAD